jgi:hypothetical protein
MHYGRAFWYVGLAMLYSFSVRTFLISIVTYYGQETH